MSDHEELADQREAEAAELEEHGEMVGASADEARKALQALEDDSVIATPLGDEDATAQEDTESEDEANVVEGE